MRVLRPDELQVLVHGQHALTLSVETTGADKVDHGHAWPMLSVAWSTEPDAFDIGLWIDDCLPENGSREPFNARAGSAMIERGVRGTAGAAPLIAWANPDVEYPGAVTFESVCAEPEQPSYVPLSDTEIGERLYEAWRVANAAHKGHPASYPERRTSLSGMRGKIGLAQIDGQWHAPHGTALSTWIAKHEDSRRLRGEAGIESLCQETMRLLGVPSANTRARVFADQQCVLSERCDRRTDPRTGQVIAIHQEDFAQATSWPGGMKYDGGSKQEPRWPAAYALLREHALFAQLESEKLTRMLAVTWMLGHGDLHRRNLGFTHFHNDGRRHIRLAPMYDVSSAVGTHLDQTLAIGIARQQQLSEIGVRQWLAHAEQCGLDPNRTLQIALRTASEAPDAVATARNTVRTRDENRHQSAVDRRAEKMIQYAERRRRVFTEEQTRRSGRASSLTTRSPESRPRVAAEDATAPPPTPGSSITD